MGGSPSDSGRKKAFVTASGLSLPSSMEALGSNGPLEAPGQAPFTRGIHAQMYRSRLWTMRQYAGFGSARVTNERFRYLLERGQTGLSVAFDLPTQIGYDSDHPLAVAEAGQVGVAVNSIRDFEVLFEDIPLGEVSTSMTINATALALFSMYVVLARRQGVAAERIRGTVQNDILKEFVARGNYRFDVAPSMRLVVDLLRFQQEVAPNFNPISVSGYHMREAGCSAVQEIAFTLGDGLAYLQAALEGGLDVTATARRMSFFFNAHNELFEEVGKFRAARRLWARTLQDRFGVEDPRAQQLRFHVQTGGSTLTSQQPLNNAVRVTVQAMAAVLGGAQSLHTNGYDEAISLPSAESALLALRTQQILAHESGIADTVDPLGGAPVMEHLTDSLEAEAGAMISQIQEDFGGMVGAVSAGFVQREIHREAMRHQRQVESGERVVVGVNDFVLEDETPAKAFRPDPAARQSIQEELEAARSSREAAAVETALGRLQDAAGQEEPLGPLFLDAVEAGTTVGEICSTLETVFPAWQAPAVI